MALRPKTEAKRLYSFRLPDELMKRLTSYADARDVYKSSVVEEFIFLGLMRIEHEAPEPVKMAGGLFG